MLLVSLALGQDFVLFNCYFPAMRSKDKFEFQVDEERYIFKQRFNLFLHQAISSMHGKGRRVVLVGDLNISLKREDSCDPSDDFDSSPSRLWLRSLLEDQQLADLFRSFHPHDKQVYTCWNQQTGARLTNYGTRIDYVLAHHSLLQSGHSVRLQYPPTPLHSLSALPLECRQLERPLRFLTSLDRRGTLLLESGQCQRLRLGFRLGLCL